MLTLSRPGSTTTSSPAKSTSPTRASSLSGTVAVQRAGVLSGSSSRCASWRAASSFVSLLLHHFPPFPPSSFSMTLTHISPTGRPRCFQGVLLGAGQREQALPPNTLYVDVSFFVCPRAAGRRLSCKYAMRTDTRTLPPSSTLAAKEENETSSMTAKIYDSTPSARPLSSSPSPARSPRAPLPHLLAPTPT
jgi:hypothetical protein